MDQAESANLSVLPDKAAKKCVLSLQEHFGSLDRLVGRSPAMLRLKDRIRKAAACREHVLILGNTGSGKTVAAELIHYLSAEASGSFHEFNVASFAEPLIESELFGHEKGAFTGADRRKIGIFERVGMGTLFLDEIGDMPLATQVKLLKAIEGRSFTRVGGHEILKFKGRVITATCKNLDAEVVAGRFREDLFFRLDVIRIEIPPLGLRVGDLPLLIRHFLGEPALLTEGAVRRLTEQAWRGEVRQLENFLKKLAFEFAPPYTEAQVNSLLATNSAGIGEPRIPATTEVKVVMLRNLILDAVAQTDGSFESVRHRLNTKRSTLYSWIKKCGWKSLPRRGELSG